jgi:hypothetical protein
MGLVRLYAIGLALPESSRSLLEGEMDDDPLTVASDVGEEVLAINEPPHELN